MGLSKGNGGLLGLEIYYLNGSGLFVVNNWLFFRVIFNPFFSLYNGISNISKVKELY